MLGSPTLNTQVVVVAVDQFAAALVDLKCFTGFPVRVDLFPCYEQENSLLSDHYKIEKQYIIQFIIEHNPEI